MAHSHSSIPFLYFRSAPRSKALYHVKCAFVIMVLCFLFTSLFSSNFGESNSLSLFLPLLAPASFSLSFDIDLAPHFGN